ncbi:MAG: alpha/beta hydrolase [Bryobacteraceae bacterium]
MRPALSTAALALILMSPSFCADKEINGDWIGGYERNGNWILFRTHFEGPPDQLGGNLDFLNGSSGISLLEGSVADGSIHFRVTSGPRDVTFDGKQDSTGIRGTARGKAGWTGPFQLTRNFRLNRRELQEYTGVYQTDENRTIFVDLWDGLGSDELVTISQAGEVRTIYSTDRDKFFAGPTVALPTSVESRISFQRDRSGSIISMTWGRGADPSWTAKRTKFENQEEVRFRSRDVELAGTLRSPLDNKKHPAIILVHGSGPENRDWLLPYARFLVRQGFAVLGYDKRGVGASSGAWKLAPFEDFAGDAAAAFEYLKTRADIDPKGIGLLGISQAGWVMPLAAERAKDIAFLISVSGPGIPVAQTNLDELSNEMRMVGTDPGLIAEIVKLTEVSYRFAQTRDNWEEYLTLRQALMKRGAVPESNFPADPNDPTWNYMRQVYFRDPGEAIRNLRMPVLAIFGGLDNNVLPEKNRAAWEAALRDGKNMDYSLLVLPKANHLILEARAGTSAEIPTLQRFVPEYFSIVSGWLATRFTSDDATR